MASVQKVARGNPIGLAAAGLAIGLIALGRSRLNSAKLDDEKLGAYDDDCAANSVDWAESHPYRSNKLQNRPLQDSASRPLIALAAAAGIGAWLGGLLPASGL